MNCLHCHSSLTTQLRRTTSLGYQTFYCRECLSSFNERTGTRFNFLEVPTDIVFQVLICRLRYKMSLRDVAEFFLLRGFEFTQKRCGSGKSDLRPWLPNNCEQNARERWVEPGTSTRRTFESKAGGTICIGQWMKTAI